MDRREKELRDLCCCCIITTITRPCDPGEAVSLPVSHKALWESCCWRQFDGIVAYDIQYTWYTGYTWYSSYFQVYTLVRLTSFKFPTGQSISGCIQYLPRDLLPSMIFGDYTLGAEQAARRSPIYLYNMVAWSPFAVANIGCEEQVRKCYITSSLVYPRPRHSLLYPWTPAFVSRQPDSLPWTRCHGLV